MTMAGWGKPSTVSKPKLTFKEMFKPSVELETISGLKIGIAGKAKVGKTHFALTAPLPIIVIDTEGSYKLNVTYFPRERREQIHVNEVLRFAGKRQKKIDLTESLNAMEDAIDLVTDILIASERELDETEDAGVIETIKELPFDPRVVKGTIVIDSATDIWDWLSAWIEDVGSKTSSGSLNRLEWGKPNQRYADFMMMLLRSNWNVIFTYRVKAAVSNKGEDLGYNNPRWQKNTDYWLDQICEMVDNGVTSTLMFRGGRFGRNIPDLVDPSWDTLCEHLKNYSGVTI